MKLSIINKKYETALTCITDTGYGKFPMRYSKTKGIFTASNCMLDLVNEVGTSYVWWSMLKRIKGHLILNRYNYSNTTQKHISKAYRVLTLLQIKFIEIQAPNGLTDLEEAKLQAANLMGKAIVLNRYARSPHTWEMLRAKKNLANLRLIGVVVSQKLIKEAIAKAEFQRERRLEKNRALTKAPQEGSIYV